MNKNALLILFSVLVSFKAYAQFTLSGRIRGAQQEPLSGALLSVLQTQKQTLSNNDGSYLLGNLKAGTVTIACRSIGYRDTLITVSLSANTTLDIRMEPSPYLSREIVVSATRSPSASGYAQNTLNKEDIQLLNTGQDLPYMLQLLPSAVITSDAGNGIGYTGVRIRGSDASRINVSVNGIPLNDAESQLVYWVNMPDFASSAENIQVQRGAGTSVNGAGAFGGSINVLTQSLTDTAYVQSVNGMGSFNTRRHNLSFGTGKINQHFSLEGRLSKTSSDGYIERASADLKSFYVSTAYEDAKNTLRLNVFSGKEITYQSWYGTPESRVNGDLPAMLEYSIRNGLTDEETSALINSGRTYNFYTYDDQVDNYQQDHYQLLYSRHLVKSWSMNIALHATRGAGFYEEYKKNQSLENYSISAVTLNDSTITSSDLIRRRWLDNWFWGTTWSLQGNPTSDLEIIWGGAANRYMGDHFGEVIWARFASDSEIRQRYYDNTATKDDLNTYAKLQWKAGNKTTAFTDLQLRKVDYAFAGPDQNGFIAPQNISLLFFNPKAGFSYKASSSMNLYGSVAVAQREPNRNDYTESSSSSRPKPERMIDYEAGIQWSSQKAKINANLYYMDYYDQLVLNGKINDVGSYTRVNIDRSYRTGIELETAVQLGKKASLQANATLSDNRIARLEEFSDEYDADFNPLPQRVDTYRNTPIAFSPSFTSTLLLQWRPLKRTELNLIVRHVGRQFLDNTGNSERTIPAYTVSDIRLGYAPAAKWCKSIRFDVMVNNLFSTLYSSNGYTYGYYYDGTRIQEDFFYPQATANFIGQMTLRF